MDLPVPSDEAINHSNQLKAIVQSVIEQEGGALPFIKYMELALYYPGLGYYSAGARTCGEERDFITAPELGGGFAYA